MLGVTYEKGGRLAIFITPKTSLLTILEIESVYSVNIPTENKNKPDEIMSLPMFKVYAEFPDRKMNSNEFSGDRLVKSCLEDEHLALRVLLCMNNGRVHDEDGEEKMEKGGKGGEGRKVSLLVPLCPLTAKQVAMIGAKPGCAVCGEENARRCGRCGIMNYCGAGAFSFSSLPPSPSPSPFTLTHSSSRIELSRC